jgi:hypothetical protein
MIPEVSTSTSGENIAESNEDFENEVNSAKNALLADAEAEIPEASPMFDGTISSMDLKNVISSFDTNNNDTVQVYESE